MPDRNIPGYATFLDSFWRSLAMNSVIYFVGLIVVVLAVLSFVGLR